VTALRAAVIAAAGFLIAAIALLVILLQPRPSGQADAPPPRAATADAVPARTIKARLFYVSEDGTRLTSVEREVPFAEGGEQARGIIAAQIAPAPATQLARFEARDALALPAKADELERALEEIGFAPERFADALAAMRAPPRQMVAMAPRSRSQSLAFDAARICAKPCA